MVGRIIPESGRTIRPFPRRRPVRGGFRVFATAGDRLIIPSLLPLIATTLIITTTQLRVSAAGLFLIALLVGELRGRFAKVVDKHVLYVQGSWLS